jgi:predicted transcriptional regulator
MLLLHDDRVRLDGAGKQTMPKRRQFVLDDRTNELLEELAADRAGNLSFVVREAIQLYADMDSRLDQIEQDPEFQRMMERSEDDIREGRLVSHEEAKRRSRRKTRKS